MQCNNLWTEEEIQNLWREFVLENKEVFKEAIAYGLVNGLYDHYYSDWIKWESDCNEYRDKAIIYARRDCDIFNESIWKNWLEKKLKN